MANFSFIRLKRIFVSATFLFGFHVWPCSPSVNFKFPTLKDSFAMADKVFYGHVKSREENSEGGFKIQISVEKYLKGTGGRDLSFNTRPGSTCDEFGTTAVPDSACVVFLNADNYAISGIFNGTPSLCVPKDSPQAKTLLDRYNGLPKGSNKPQ